MNNIITHFKRTIEFAHIIGIHLFDNPQFENDNIGLEDFKTLFYQKIEKLKDAHKDRIQEIFSIEEQKIQLIDPDATVKEIFNKEVLYTVKREDLLLLEFDTLMSMKFSVNPLITLCMSKWEWSQRRPFPLALDYTKILQIREDECYFLMERTGTWDTMINSNIIESLITEFDFIVLDSFQNTQRTLRKVQESFVSLFDAESEEDFYQLHMVFNSLIKELIFRRYIISY